MCGRYTLISIKEIIADEFHLPLDELREIKARYNIAPSQTVPVLLRDPEPVVPLVRWGLIPSWAKDEAIGSRLINARSETLREKPAFRGLYKKQRCLIPADGFYEWKKEGRVKTPHYIRLKSGRPFSFAGLWSRWRNPAGDEIKTFTIITCEANAVLAPVHDRMPVILADGEREAWLDPDYEDLASLSRMLDSYPADEMESYPVSTRVNSPKNESPECIDPVVRA